MELLNFTNKNKISLDDLSFLNELLKTGMPLNKALELLINKKNEKILKRLIDDLADGKIIESIIGEYIPKDLDVYLSSLLKTLPFVKALDMSLSFYNESEENEKTIISATAYPIALLFISLTALYLFDLYGLDSIFNLLSGFNTNLSFYKSIRIAARCFIYFIYFGFITIAGLVMYFSRDKRVIMFYEWLCRYFPNSIVQSYFCEEFISLLLICQKLGYKTRESLKYLKSLIKKPIISVLAFNMDKSLESGSSLKEASESMWYDPLLNGYIKIASFTKNFEAILENYVSISKLRIKRKMKSLATSIQIAIYVFIGLIIIFIYQILFLPMQAMGNF